MEIGRWSSMDSSSPMHGKSICTGISRPAVSKYLSARIWGIVEVYPIALAELFVSRKVCGILFSIVFD